tara:strand:- start:500 stop:844 length:345 start_codon:yes stop_codon:yes gene_type:complete
MYLALSIGTAGFVLAYPQSSFADDILRNKDFLQLPAGDRNVWLDGAMLMAGHMVHLHDSEKARCAWNWYFDNPAKAQATLLASMQTYPQSTPTGVIIAHLRKACGEPLIAGESE